MKKFRFQLITANGNKMFTEAENEEKAWTSFKRKRDAWNESYSSVNRGTITNLGLTEESQMQENGSLLIAQLKEQTKSLRVQYIAKVKNWAKEEFERVTPMRKWSEEQWCKWLGIKAEKRASRFDHTQPVAWRFPKNFFNMYEHKLYGSANGKAASMLATGLEKYVAQAEKGAEDHYENSIIKLAIRIMKKGMSFDNLKMTTTHLGVNIETIISDGEKVVKAWTIIAEGPIQRPHYRYLVK